MSISRWLSDMLEILSWSEGGEIAYEDFIFQREIEKESSPSRKKQNRDSDEVDDPEDSLPEELPILPLRGMVVFPLTGVTLTIGQPRSIRLVDDVVASDRLIGLVASKKPEMENPGPEDLYQVGTVATVHRMFRAPDDTIRLLVQGTHRFKTEEYTQDEPYLKARIQLVPEDDAENLEVEALARNVRGHFERIAEMITSIPQEIIASVLNLDDPLQVVYAIANFQRMELEEAQNMLEIDPVLEKLHKLNAMLSREVEVLELGQKIQNEARSEIEKVQRDYFLREQLKAIQKELGEKDEHTAEVDEFRQKIKEAKMPEEAGEQANREAERLERINPASAEYGVIRTYLEWLVTLPWAKETPDNLDIPHAREVLDEDHYGLKDVKERILEYLAVRKLRQERHDEWERTRKVDAIRQEREGVILCFVGPPGVGKTSLGRSIARALGREFIRISLGGVRDEAEIRGHRRTYIGALPGRIIQALRRVESKNPVFMMDEIDKLGHDFRGDPASALLEVLDPEQNSEFRDHYLEVSFDLSQVMFITTANLLEPIPAPLRDRMEIINISSYTENDKIEIAKKYLITRQLREKGLRRKEVSFHKGAIQKIVRSYTREAGVRNLEREIGRICRKVVTQIASGETG
ncbi:MAG: endopeptidase La, partial [Anaerolineae bacterium]|nr:endopeptidase La [Anaerolineae bacterium]